MSIDLKEAKCLGCGYAKLQKELIFSKGEYATSKFSILCLEDKKNCIYFNCSDESYLECSKAL
ncbi:MULTISPECIES: hypothetical protein [Psychrilyobacter]|uniref:Uncharacterized protein n=1 Tax=Psychrilyobacter piezotolerans TaxID=2293438 RepID=A0ABX9KJS6_9FUSO|nr:MULTISPECIES: hypothetical protein [Psychrilyobacter]MCS5422775.1 hypothetical protein [Psychrilyobacter sp. S5]NDI76936.1 hypothetical protein [Psychrilyobacter piezotolerans]RDE64560.1 hypothetical protein DV867_03195 [Psychrilyobacter sp. S5]REI42372.1 hypothetical protein DYH56_03195 [Psychrilyobacter piezotolerans]